MLIRIGIIGAGFIAPTHIQTFREFPDRCEVLAICDLRQDLVEKRVKEFQVRGYSDYRKMIETEKLDVVCLCTPPGTHEAIVIDLVSMGVHVFCEKPLAMNADQGRRMVAAVEKAGVIFQVGYCHRFEEAPARIRKSIAAGEFGPITSYRNVFASDWGYCPTRGGNLMDNGSHAADLARFFLGDPIKVIATQFRPWTVKDLDEVVDFSALLSGPNDEMIFLEAGGRHSGGRFLVDLCGQKTSALFDYAQGILRWCSEGNWQEIDTKGAPGRFHRQADHFLDCLEHKAKCLVDIHEAQKTLELLGRIAQAAGDVITK